VSLEHIIGTGEIPRHHDDPFERLTVCPALVDGFAIVTPDGGIPKYPAYVLW